ncbi:MAG: serine/threonine protein kinase [Armatimonadota bacterium]|nr:MAG: serine/threonine protein kinase [Armatimonadota bacterium]
MQSLVGQVINFRYEVLEKTGEGGLFTVYRTRDRVMNRLAAVKVLRPDYASDPEISQRILERAKALVALSHPNVTRVYEAARTEHCAYVCEEHVRGIDLKERIRRIAPFTAAAAVDVAIAVAQALDYLHRNGIVHGDLRPHKVLVGPEGEIKVTGAGLAFAFADQEEKRTLALMRAAHYAAPETFEGRMPDERSDIYSLGIILFEMLAGMVPFTGDTPIAVATRHARDPVPSVRDQNAAVPRALEGIIRNALAKDPDERYQTAREILADLRSVQDALRLGKPLNWSPLDPSRAAAVVDEPAPREESLWKSFAKAALLVVLVAAVVFGGFMLLVKSSPPDVNVPDVVGKDLEEARRILSDTGLTLTIAREDFNDRYPAGAIYFQEPQAGQPVKKNAIVEVYVSKGSRNVRVPSVVGMSEEKAREILNEEGLVVGEVKYDYSSSIPAGDVMRQDPRPGLSVAREAAKVDLTVSLGPPPGRPAVPPPPVEETAPDAPSITPSETPAAPASPEKPVVTRQLRIRFSVPEGPSVRVQIVVKDDTGEWVAVDDVYRGGSPVSATFTVTGKSAEIRTLINGREVDRQVR